MIPGPVLKSDREAQRKRRPLLAPGDQPDPGGEARAEQFYAEGGKPSFVHDVFERIAGRYDLLNTVMTFGMHHRWRKAAVRMADLREGDSALDVACGTGDFLPLLRRAVGQKGEVTGLDFSAAMLRIADAKLRKRQSEAVLVQGGAENLPFESESQQAVTIGFALRNLADQEACFREMHRVLACGGRVVALEIARPGWWPYRPVFLWYFEKVLPRLARVFRGEKLAYEWLPASLAAFCSREGVTRLMRKAGFADISVRNLAGGSVCIYRGVKH